MKKKQKEFIEKFLRKFKEDFHKDKHLEIPAQCCARMLDAQNSRN